MSRAVEVALLAGVGSEAIALKAGMAASDVELERAREATDDEALAARGFVEAHERQEANAGHEQERLDAQQAGLDAATVRREAAEREVNRPLVGREAERAAEQEPARTVRAGPRRARGGA